jgi:hypothetical protein
MHDDEGRPFVIHDDNTLVAGDRFPGMPGNSYFLGPDRGHDPSIAQNRTEAYGSGVRGLLFQVPEASMISFFS